MHTVHSCTFLSLSLSLSLFLSVFFFLSRYIQCIYAYRSFFTSGSHVSGSGMRNFITTSKFRSFAESANVTRDGLRFNPIYNEKSKGLVGLADFSIFVWRFCSYAYKSWTPHRFISRLLIKLRTHKVPTNVWKLYPTLLWKLCATSLQRKVTTK